MTGPRFFLWKLLLCSVLLFPKELTATPVFGAPTAVIGDDRSLHVNSILEPKNGTVWTSRSTAKITWITNASDPHTLQPVNFSEPLTIRLWKDFEDSTSGRLLPVLFDEVAYRGNGSVTVNVPLLEQGPGYGVVIYTNNSSSKYWSELFVVGPSN